MLAAIKYGLTHLLDFNGRDARQTFWYYVLFVYIVGQAISMSAMIGPMMRMMRNMFDVAAQHDPQRILAEQQAFIQQLTGPIIYLGAAVTLFNLLVLAAAFVRRLHDSDLSGWWALVIGALQAGITAMTLCNMRDLLAMVVSPDAMIHGDMHRFILMSLAGYLPLALFIYLGARKSSDGPNRFGADPVRF